MTKGYKSLSYYNIVSTDVVFDESIMFHPQEKYVVYARNEQSYSKEVSYMWKLHRKWVMA